MLHFRLARPFMRDALFAQRSLGRGRTWGLAVVPFHSHAIAMGDAMRVES